MSKTKIEWCDCTVNPVKGMCPVDCKNKQGKSYCYARAMYKRFKWDETIRFDVDALAKGILESKTGSRIFFGSTIELFGNWVDPIWLHDIFKVIKSYPDRTFIFLTKQPQNLQKWSPFPENCWVGFSSPTEWSYEQGIKYINDINAKLKFISFEPLCDRIDISSGQLLKAGVGWVILGQQTPIRQATMPKIEWIREIVAVADKSNVPVFLKDNLWSLLPYERPFCKTVNLPISGEVFIRGMMRREFPITDK